MALTDNLVSYWKLNESSDGSGAVTRNDSHSTNHLTDNNTTASATGKLSLAANFVAANSESLSITDAAQTGLDITGDISIMFWAQFDAEAENSYPLYKGKTDGNQRQYWVYTVGNDIQLAASDDGTTNAGHYVSIGTAGDWITYNGTTWYHIALVFDISAESLTAYINNVSRATSLIDGTGIGASIYNGTGPLQIGSRYTTAPATFFDGRICALSIYNGLLTSDDVAASYNSGNGLEYPFGATATNHSLLMGV